jgi:hypothetical protein
MGDRILALLGAGIGTELSVEGALRSQNLC